MNKPYQLIILLLISTGLVPSKDNIEYKSAFEDSFDAWIDFKRASGNTYSYIVTSGSWTGTSSETRISVREGKVVGRNFILRHLASDRVSGYDILEEWYENEAQINTHENGAPPITLDEVYSKARSKWLIKRQNTETYFEANNNGMISTCGYRDRDCADDCFTGINISFIGIEKFYNEE